MGDFMSRNVGWALLECMVAPGPLRPVEIVKLQETLDAEDKTEDVEEGTGAAVHSRYQYGGVRPKPLTRADLADLQDNMEGVEETEPVVLVRPTWMGLAYGNVMLAEVISEDD